MKYKTGTVSDIIYQAKHSPKVRKMPGKYIKQQSNTKWTPEIIEKWIEGLENGTLTNETISERWGVRRDVIGKKISKFKAGDYKSPFLNE